MIGGRHRKAGSIECAASSGWMIDHDVLRGGERWRIVERCERERAIETLDLVLKRRANLNFRRHKRKARRRCRPTSPGNAVILRHSLIKLCCLYSSLANHVILRYFHIKFTSPPQLAPRTTTSPIPKNLFMFRAPLLRDVSRKDQNGPTQLGSVASYSWQQPDFTKPVTCQAPNFQSIM